MAEQIYLSKALEELALKLGSIEAALATVPKQEIYQSGNEYGDIPVPRKIDRTGVSNGLVC